MSAEDEKKERQLQAAIAASQVMIIAKHTNNDLNHVRANIPTADKRGHALLDTAIESLNELQEHCRSVIPGAQGG